MHAIHADYAIANELLNCKVAEYAKAVVDGRPSFHIALALDVSPCCDCHNYSDVPIVPNVGMFASFDPVALDTACADKINAQSGQPRTASSRTSMTTRTTTSPPRTRTPTGAPPSSTARPSASARRTTSSSTV